MWEIKMKWQYFRSGMALKAVLGDLGFTLQTERDQQGFETVN